MSFEDPSYWLTVIVTAGATAGGVFLAFSLERRIERLRDDDAAYWLARAWAHEMTRRSKDGSLATFVRFLAYGRMTPKRPVVQAALRRVDPRVEQWWSKATECLVEAENSWLSGSDVGHRARSWANEIDAEFERASTRGPSRHRRLERLISSLAEPPKLKR